MDLATFFNANDAISEFSKNYLVKRGWFYSINGASRNNEGEVPWITYPAFLQLKRIVRPSFKVFEYGCGASSLWWARNVAEVRCVEHNALWGAQVSANKPENLSVAVHELGADTSEAERALVEPFFAAMPELPVSNNPQHDVEHGLLCPQFIAYVTELAKYPAGTFDVIVVDGMARSLAAWLAARYLKDDGFILFDNTDRWQYNAGFRSLRDSGFYRLDYYGPGPASSTEWCTSIFTKSLKPFADSVDSPKDDGSLGW